MTTTERTHILKEAEDSAPRHLSKEEFGRRLYRLMIKKGLRQSDLARRAGMLRSNVSAYVRGNAYPTSVNLTKLAKALDCEPEELLPNHLAGSIAEDRPAFEIKVSPADPTRAWLKIDRAVSADTASQIAALILADGTADRN